ncbi:MAG: BrnA antitoxin family protein, partial [Bacteroidetes bacterium]|nr:BrnA antitoxin family protein [Bacteroidota bacterium]
KKTTKKISLSIPFDLFEKIKVRANKFDIPYQNLIKMYILKAYNEYLQK